MSAETRQPAPQDSKERRLEWIVFAVIMLVAAAMRLWQLGTVPPSIFRDEAEKALNGWFLLNSGMDASGRPWPVFIEVFGVTTSAIYQYATIPFLALGGLNEWTTRLPAACVGIATVLLTWLLVRRIWNWQTAAWAAALLAVSPWHVPLSRWAQQGIFLPLFFTAAALFVARFLSEEKPRARWLALAGACVALAMYAYDPARLFAPLLALAAAVIWWPTWAANRRAVVIGLASFAIFISPVAWLLSTQGEAATARFRFLSIVQPGMTTAEIALQFIRNYGSHFSFSFLLFDGDAELRHSAGRGMLGTAEFILAVAGVLYTVISKNRWCWFFLLWVLLAPLPASLTREGIPHALRSQMALPAWQVLAAFGIMELTRRSEISLKRRLGRGLRWYEHAAWPFLILTSAMAFYTDYFKHYPEESAASWQYGVKESLDYLNQPTTSNSEVIFYYVTGAEYLVPFYLKMDRSEFRRMLAGQTRYKFADPRTPLESWLINPPQAPRAIVAPIGVPPVEGSYNMFIDAPGGHGGSRAVMQIFRSPDLIEQVQPDPAKPPS